MAEKNSEKDRKEKKLKEKLKKLEKKYGIDFLNKDFEINKHDYSRVSVEEGEKKVELEITKEDRKLDKINYKKKPSKKKIKGFSKKIDKLKKEIAKVVVGQEEIVDGLIRGLLCRGHVLLEGVPGIAKTLAIKTLGKASGCSAKRVQFTVDLLPTDITGITIYHPKKGFETVKGPIFTNFMIADEINRAPPKTQSALIEGMQERQVTIGKKNFSLPKPFFVMATENPLETSGVYPLPEAQIDRFLFKLIMKYPKKYHEKTIVENNATLKNFEDYGVKAVISPKDIIKLQEIVKNVYIGSDVKAYLVEIISKTRDKKFKGSKYVSWGASPRASIALFIASKARALMEGRDYVIPEDVKVVAHDVLRHRLILSYQANIENITSDEIIDNVLDEVEVV